MPIKKNDPDQRNDAELIVEQHQHEQRADAGRGNGREDRNRMDQALVQNGQDDIRSRPAPPGSAKAASQRILERLRIALERRQQPVRNVHLPLDFGDGFNRLASAAPGARLKDSVIAGNSP